MKFNLLVKHVDSDDVWKEPYDKDCDNAEDMGRSIIDYWNDTLRSHETAREFVGVEVLDKQEIAIVDPQKKQIEEDHKTLEDWVKNGEVYATQTLYTSHIKGLVDLNYTEEQLEEKIDKISKYAYEAFVNTLDIEEFENKMGDYSDAFAEGFAIQYMENYEKIKQDNGSEKIT